MLDLLKVVLVGGPATGRTYNDLTSIHVLTIDKPYGPMVSRSLSYQTCLSIFTLPLRKPSSARLLK